MKNIGLVLVAVLLVSMCFAQMPAMAVTVGNAAIDRAYGGEPGNDSWRTTIVTPGTSSISGVVTSWTLFAKSTGDVYLQVWRKLPDMTISSLGFIDEGGYLLVGQNKVSVTNTGVNTFSISSLDQVTITAGDYIGFTGPEGLIAQDYAGGEALQWATADNNAWPLYTRARKATAVGTVIAGKQLVSPWDLVRNAHDYVAVRNGRFSLQANVGPGAAQSLSQAIQSAITAALADYATKSYVDTAIANDNIYDASSEHVHDKGSGGRMTSKPIEPIEP